MPIRDILFPMISYPTPTAIGTVETAVGLAGSLGAHISGLTFELDIRSPVGLYAHPANVGGILAAERAKSAANARDLVAALDDIAARRNVMHERTVEHCPPIEVGQSLVAHARLRDLSVFPVNTADPGQRSLIEELMFESGRPVGGIHGGKKNAPDDSGAITFSGTFSGTLVGARSGAGAGAGV